MFNANLGRALYARGFTRTLAVMHPDGTHNDRWKKSFPFDPVAFEHVPPGAMTAEQIKVRWGYDVALVAGTAGERVALPDPTPEILDGLMLPPGYQWTDMDIADAGRLTRDGKSWAIDDPLSGLPHPEAPPVDPPGPPHPPVDPPTPPAPVIAWKKPPHTVAEILERAVRGQSNSSEINSAFRRFRRYQEAWSEATGLPYGGGE